MAFCCCGNHSNLVEHSLIPYHNHTLHHSPKYLFSNDNGWFKSSGRIRQKNYVLTVATKGSEILYKAQSPVSLQNAADLTLGTGTELKIIPPHTSPTLFVISPHNVATSNWFNIQEKVARIAWILLFALSVTGTFVTLVRTRVKISIVVIMDSKSMAKLVH